MLGGFVCGCAHSCCRDWGFPVLPDCPSPSIRLWVYWFQWLLFSTGGSLPLRWGHPYGVEVWFVLDRNEGVVPPFESGPLVSAWLDLQPLSAASLRALSLRVCCRDGPPYVRGLRLSLAPSGVLPCPLLGLRVASAALAAVWGCLGCPALLLPACVLYLGLWLGLRPAAAGALLPEGPPWSCGS